MKRSESVDRGPPGKRRRGARGARPSSAFGSGEELDEGLLGQMFDYLDSRGGVADFGAFSGAFNRVPKRSLEPHFDFVPVGNPADGLWDICIRGAGHPGGAPGGGEEVFGRIINYYPAKGYGFLKTPACAPDVFFPKGALPRELQEAPIERLRDMEVALVLSDRDGKPRAERLDPIPGSAPHDRSRPMPPPPMMEAPRERGESRDGSMFCGLAAGRIARYEEAKGFGFIQRDDGGEDIFFLRSELPPEMGSGPNIRKEQILDIAVEFEVHEMPDRKFRAKKLMVIAHPGHGGQRGGGGGRKGGGGGLPVGSGVIRSYDAAKGFGFVTPDGRGEDLFYLKSELPPELSGREPTRNEVVDQHVEFEVKTMPDGKLRAERMRFIQPRGGDQRGGGRPGGRKAAGGGGGGGGSGMPGRIRNFNRSKGYGFIEVPGESENVFFLPSALPKHLADSDSNLDGMEILFEAFRNEEGKPRAKNIMEAPHGGRHGPPPMMPPPMMPPPMMPPPMMPPPMMPPPSMGGPPMPDGRIVVGCVITFDAAKGFGFLKAEGIAGDIFFPRSELPPDLREVERNDIMGKYLECELRKMPDGKLRAKKIVVLRNTQGAKGPRTRGRVVKFTEEKGYGFIACEFADNVFFLRSALPKEFHEADLEELKELELSFELYSKEQGKPRANNLEVVGSSRHDADDEDKPRIESGEVLVGEIVNFECPKGFGFVRSPRCSEDIYFVRAEMPQEISSAQKKEEVIRRRVEFEVVVMPDGKMRASKMLLLDDDVPLPPAEETEEDLDDSLLQEMGEFLASKGNGTELGYFSSQFPKIKKRKLQQHFDIFPEDGQQGPGGRHRIELRPDHPMRVDVEDEVKEDAVRDADMQEYLDGDIPEAPDEDPAANMADDDADDIDPNEPSIPLGPGVTPLGVIRSYDAEKGFGFIRCRGLPEDVFFPRSALPKSFHGRNAKDMPELLGVQVSFDYKPSGGKGPRTDKLNLLLRWLKADECWVLNRSAIPPKPKKAK